MVRGARGGGGRCVLESSADAEGSFLADVESMLYTSLLLHVASVGGAAAATLLLGSERKLTRTLGERGRKRPGCPGHKYWWSGLPAAKLLLGVGKLRR